MKNVSKRTIRRRLQNLHASQPPEELAGKIKRDIPEGLFLGLERSTSRRFKESRIWFGWKMAACFIVFIVGTLIGVFISQRYFTGVLFNDDTQAPETEERGVLNDDAFTSLSNQFIDGGGFIRAAANPRSTFDLEPQSASFNLVKRRIKEGKLPPPESVKFDDVITYFQPEVAELKDDFTIETEGGSSPFTNDPSFKVLKINIKAPDLSQESRKLKNIPFETYSKARADEGMPVTWASAAKNTKLEIVFNPNVVDIYRYIGIGDTEHKKSIYIISEPDVKKGAAATALYEMRLKRKIRPNDAVATLKFQYSPVGEDEQGIIKLNTIQVPVLVTNLEKESPDLEFTAMLAEYAQALKDLQKIKEHDLKYLLERAKVLARDVPRKEDIEEFIQLVEATEKLTKEIRSKKADLDSMHDKEQ